MIKLLRTRVTEIFMLVSAIGFTDALFLTKQHYSRDPFACPIFGGCETVTSSVYSEVFGVPISLLGTLYYGIIFFSSLYIYLTSNKKWLSLVAQFTVAGMVTSLGLLYLMIYVIQAVCFYCMLSVVSSTLLFVVGAIYLSSQKNYVLKPLVAYFRRFKSTEILLGIIRICIGFIFLWAFIDKVEVWLSGGSPAAGYLAKGTSGIFAQFFASIAYNPLVNHMYMFGLFSVGLGLTLGFASRLATIGGISMMLLIYTGNLPPAHNPIIDEHVIYALVLLFLYKTKADRYFGLGKS